MPQARSLPDHAPKQHQPHVGDNAINAISEQLEQWQLGRFRQLYIVLIDLTDAIADALQVPCDRIFLEMLYCLLRSPLFHASGRAQESYRCRGVPCSARKSRLGLA